MEMSKFEEYLIGKIEALDTKINKVDEKVTGLKAKVATVSAIVGTAMGSSFHYILKKMGV